jgi:DnaJ domain
MRTLYDLLGALPGDDAEALRVAFRKAAKATHPDMNPGDEEAPRRFRELMRAYDILHDTDQRTAYDELLSIAQQSPGTGKSTRVYESVRKFASNTILATIISAALLGGYTVLGVFSNRPGAAEVLANVAADQETVLAPSPETTVEQPRIASSETVTETAIRAVAYFDRDIIMYRAPARPLAFDSMAQIKCAKPASVARNTSMPRILKERVPSPPRRAPMVAALTP